ncbi:MAG: PTS alpha-glucoside transporter subunit IIBC [Chloroflexi bacterium]|nr:PTS alpha-glucoside transporter subunit IIBC [Chloroflexota bacterium]
MIFDKGSTSGVEIGVRNLARVAATYGARVTFAVCPEVVGFFPTDTGHEVGLHLHPGWVEWKHKGFRWHVGDSYIKKAVKQSVNSTVLKDYPYEEQLEMIKAGKQLLEAKFGTRTRVFVAGRWSVNNDTMAALIETGFTHDCSAVPHSKATHFDWSKLPRICMPYHPGKQNYQARGNLPLLFVPVSRMWLGGAASPEVATVWGLSWIKACFREYHKLGLPLFHVCLHSPSMTDPYFVAVLDELLRFISKHDVAFKFASEIKEYDRTVPGNRISPYLLGVNRNMMMTCARACGTKALRKGRR